MFTLIVFVFFRRGSRHNSGSGAFGDSFGGCCMCAGLLSVEVSYDDLFFCV